MHVNGQNGGIWLKWLRPNWHYHAKDSRVGNFQSWDSRINSEEWKLNAIEDFWKWWKDRLITYEEWNAKIVTCWAWNCKSPNRCIKQLGRNGEQWNSSSAGWHWKLRRNDRSTERWIQYSVLWDGYRWRWEYYRVRALKLSVFHRIVP